MSGERAQDETGNAAANTSRDRPRDRELIRDVDPVVGRLRRIRLDAGWTAQRLANRTGVSLATIYAVERGTRQPTLHTVRLIAQALGCDLVVKQDRLIPPPRRPS